MAVETDNPKSMPERRSAGIILSKRRQFSWPADRDFRILSLDGGGIKGLYALGFLAELEKRALAGSPIGGYFDLIAGTSTGGIIALGLSAGHSAQELLSLYLAHGAEIFPRKASFGFFRTAFKPDKLRDLL